MLAEKPCNARAMTKSHRVRAKQKTKVAVKAKARPARSGIRRDGLRSANHPAIAAEAQYSTPDLRGTVGSRAPRAMLMPKVAKSIDTQNWTADTQLIHVVSQGFSIWKLTMILGYPRSIYQRKGKDRYHLGRFSNGRQIASSTYCGIQEAILWRLYQRHCHGTDEMWKLTVKAATKAVTPISHFEDLNSRNTGGWLESSQRDINFLPTRNIIWLPYDYSPHVEYMYKSNWVGT